MENRDLSQLGGLLFCPIKPATIHAFKRFRSKQERQRNKVLVREVVQKLHTEKCFCQKCVEQNLYEEFCQEIENQSAETTGCLYHYSERLNFDADGILVCKECEAEEESIKNPF